MLGKPALGLDGGHTTGTGGSDSHVVREVGIYATSFATAIGGERDLIEALRNGDGCTPVAFRKDG